MKEKEAYFYIINYLKTNEHFKVEKVTGEFSIEHKKSGWKMKGLFINDDPIVKEYLSHFKDAAWYLSRMGLLDQI